MFEHLKSLLGSGEFMPHGFCLNWDPGLLFLLIASNVGIAIAYFAIPVALYYFVKKRGDVPYPWMFRLFGAFILACGLTHLMKIFTIYQGAYWIEGALDAFTALVSLLTAALLWPLIPQALALRSPKELEAANQELRAAKGKLEEANSELSSLNLALEAARDQALEAVNLKSTFIATMSHELRTPLSAVIGLNELLLGTEMDDTQRNFALSAQDSAETLLSLLNDVLDLAKVETGMMEIKESQIDVPDIIHKCSSMFRQQASQKSIELRLAVDPDVPRALWGDAVRLRQVLTNLVANAIKFTDQGEVGITCAVESRDRNWLRIKFTVDDTGAGIADEMSRYVFTPFTQAVATSQAGSGLGLAISKCLVDLMGGTIGFSSRLGKGSSFWFVLPLRMASLEDGKAIAKADANGHQAPAVLVVEDNLLLQTVAVIQLRNMGIEVKAVTTGREAVREATTANYDVILMDCHLPQMDGYEAARLIRRFESAVNRHVPIVAVTAKTMQGDKEKCIASGMDDYLTKPYTNEQLRQIITRWVEAGEA